MIGTRKRADWRGMSSISARIVSCVLALVAAGAVQAQQRPPIGAFGSPPDAMIFYVAHGPADACGPGCSDWIAAEGAVQWDSYKRLIAILDRQAGRKLPVVIHSWAYPISRSQAASAASCATAASTPPPGRPRSQPAPGSRTPNALR
jgi:hypothetical protein